MLNASGREQAALVVEHAAELASVAGPAGPRRGAAQGELGIVPDGAVAIGADGRILAVGPTAEVWGAVRLAPGGRVLDASGRAVLPGFVDPHTHAVFAGDRADELMRRLEGADYLEILAAGGGILSTVRATRAAGVADLRARLAGFLEAMLLHGTTTVEVKSGYGLSTAEELKLLEAASPTDGRPTDGRPADRSPADRSPAAADAASGTRPPVALPLPVVRTLLAAHAVPPEHRGDPESYVRLVCEETIPAVARADRAEFCDVFCETGVFSVEHSRQVLRAGLAHGLRPKLHAEQKSRLGGTRLAAELRATSVDHLEYAEEPDLAALAQSPDTVAVLLPGAAFLLREARRAPARRLVELGVPVALATDFNPGTCPILSVPLVVGLACLQLGLSPAEAVVAATINAAHAVGRGADRGSLERGKIGSLVVLDAPSHRYLPYYFGSNLVRTVVLAGQVVVEDGRRVPPLAHQPAPYAQPSPAAGG